MEATNELSVQVVTPEGILTPVEYAGYRANGDERVRKESQQIGEDLRGTRWAEPRVPFDDLLLFYDLNVWHRRSVVVKALLTAGLGWKLMRGGEVLYDPAEGDDVPDDPAARLLARPNPNRMETFSEIVYRWLVDRYALGNGALEVVRNRRNEVAELYHFPARTLRRDSRFDGYWQVKEGRWRKFDTYGDRDVWQIRTEVLHLYEYDPRDDYYGMPGWYASLAAMGLDRTVLEFNTRLFQNGMMAHTAVVVTGGRLSSEARDAVKRFVREQAQGVENAGRVLLLEDEDDRVKITFEKLNLDVKDLIIREVQEHFRDTVIGAHGIPPRILGIVTPGQLGATGEVEGQLRTFREAVLRPGKREVERALNVLLEDVSPGVTILFNEMDITDVKSDADFYTAMLDRAVFEPKEVRELIDRGEV